MTVVVMFNHTRVTGSLWPEPVGELGKYFPALKTMSHKTIAYPQCSPIETPRTSLVNSVRRYHYEGSRGELSPWYKHMTAPASGQLVLETPCHGDNKQYSWEQLFANE